MALRSTDMQIIIQKTSDLVRNQQLENSRNRLQQQQFAQQLQHKVESEGRQVNSLPKTYKSQIENDKQKNKKRDNRKRKKNKSSPGKADKSSVIDIKI